MNTNPYKFVFEAEAAEGWKRMQIPQNNSQNTTRADFVVYHLKFKTRVKQNLSCSKHDGGKAQGSNLLVEAVDLYCMHVLPKKGRTHPHT